MSGIESAVTGATATVMPPRILVPPNGVIVSITLGVARAVLYIRATGAIPAPLVTTSSETPSCRRASTALLGELAEGNVPKSPAAIAAPPKLEVNGVNERKRASGPDKLVGVDV